MEVELNKGGQIRRAAQTSGASRTVEGDATSTYFYGRELLF